MNHNEEFVVKAIGRLTLDLDLTLADQKKLRSSLYYTLSGFNIVKVENSLVLSDVSEKLFMYLKIKQLEGYSELTLKNYTYTLTKFASYMNKPVNNITKNDIRMFLLHYCEGKKDTTKNSIMYYIKGFFGWMESEDIIDKNPTRKLEVVKTPKRLRKSLTIEELEKLRLASIDVRDRAILEFIFSTGCRVSEVVGVNVEDINFNNNQVRVIGKGDKERIVFINDKCKLHIKNYLNCRADTNPALFVTYKHPNNRLGKRGIEIVISSIAKRAGFTKSVFPHLLRHTMATLSFQSGAPLTTIQKLLGHVNPSTSQIYADQSIDNISHDHRKYMGQ